MTILTIMITFY